MSITVECPLCGGCFKAADTYAGKRVKCPQCKGVIQIPLPEPSPQAAAPIAPKKTSSQEKSLAVEMVGQEESFSDSEQENSPELKGAGASVVRPAPVFAGESPSFPPPSFSPPSRQESPSGVRGMGIPPVWTWIVLASVVSGLVVGLVVYAALKFSGSDQSKGPTAQTEGSKSSGKPSGADKKKSTSSSDQPSLEGGAQTGSSKQTGPSKPSKSIREVLEAVVKIEMPQGEGKMGIGAGFLIDPRGWVATNYHVIQQATSATRVRLFDGAQCKVAGILAQEPSMDLAILKLADPPPRLSVLDISFSGEPELGEEIRVCGHPHNLSFTFVEGTVGRVVTTMELLKERPNPLLVQMKSPLDMVWIQHSARIAQGNSGGPVVNKQGQVLGINSFVNELSFGYAVPVRYLRALVALCNENQVTPLSERVPSEPPSNPQESPGPSPSPPSPPSPSPKTPESPPPPPPKDKPSPPAPQPGAISLSPEQLQKLYDACSEFYWKPETAEQYSHLEAFARAMAIVQHIRAHPEASPGASKEAVAACAQKADQLFAELRKSPWTKDHWSAIHKLAADQLQPNQGVILQGSILMNAEQFRQSAQPVLLFAPEGLDRKMLLLVSADYAKMSVSCKVWIIGRIVGTAQISDGQGRSEDCLLVQAAYLAKED